MSINEYEYNITPKFCTHWNTKYNYIQLYSWKNTLPITVVKISAAS